MSSIVQLQLTKEEAFTLLEALARYVYDGGALSVVTEQETEAIQSVCESLNNELVEQFRSEYKKFAQRRNKRSQQGTADLNSFFKKPDHCSVISS